MNKPAPTIAQYCQENILLLPHSLHEMADTRPIIHSKEAAIFYKSIKRDMVDIEFFSHIPCLVYIMSGVETFTTFDHEQIRLCRHEMLFMPKNMHMISDFKNKTGPLRAFLFFFDQSIISDFLHTTRPLTSAGPRGLQPYKLPANQYITKYMHALEDVYSNISGTQQLLHNKLLELLLLLDQLMPGDELRIFLQSLHQHAAKRNIKKLMQDYPAHIFSLKDFAALSGRTIERFSRDFKRQFGISPKQWLIEKRLENAMELVQKNELSITQLAQEVGYNNTSHFIKAFKARYGQTPKQLRAKINI